ncbi:MAG TPA: hypothetical protein PKN99_07590, partial [Cyclobacteriaceae bacterium]|nr:hypothetical protein [Cyclobacteriaceae bacterium]
GLYSDDTFGVVGLYKFIPGNANFTSPRENFVVLHSPRFIGSGGIQNPELYWDRRGDEFHNPLTYKILRTPHKPFHSGFGCTVPVVNRPSWVRN